MVGWLAGSFVGCLAHGARTGLSMCGMLQRHCHCRRLRSLLLLLLFLSSLSFVVVVEELVVVVSKMKKTNAKTITTTPGKQSILTHLLSFGLVWLSSVVVFVVARLLASHCVFVSISTFCCYFPLNGCWLFGLLNGATCDRQIDRPTNQTTNRSFV